MSQSSKDNQPEAFSFSNVSSGVNVDPATGDFSYQIPLITIPGPEGDYVVNLNYKAGISPNEDASWVGLGWSLSPGSVSRMVRGTPDDIVDYKTREIIRNGATYLEQTQYNFLHLWVIARFGFKSKTGFSTIKDYNFLMEGGFIYSQAGGTWQNAAASFLFNIQNNAYIISNYDDYAALGNIAFDPQFGSSGTRDFSIRDGSKWVSNKDNFFIDNGTFSHWWRLYGESTVHSAGTLFPGKALHMGQSGEEDDDGEAWGKQSYHYRMDMYTNNSTGVQENKMSSNLSFPAYDSYYVSGNGISGEMTPRIFRDGSLLDRAYEPSTYIGVDYNIKKDNSYNYFSENTDLNANENNIHFIFSDGVHSKICRTPGSIDVSDWSDIPGQLITKNYDITNRKLQGGKYVRTLMDSEGIKGFSITNEEGYTYHYLIPEYQYERGQRIKRDDDGDAVKFVESRSFDKYAYSWLLSKITGPDYVDKLPMGLGAEDYGYWVGFSYTTWANAYIWKDPYSDDYKHIEEVPDTVVMEWGRKDLKYLHSIYTASHIAYFVKFVREDALGSDYEDNRKVQIEIENYGKYNRDWNSEFDDNVSLEYGDAFQILSSGSCQYHNIYSNVAPVWNFHYDYYNGGGTDKWPDYGLYHADYLDYVFCPLDSICWAWYQQNAPGTSTSGSYNGHCDCFGSQNDQWVAGKTNSYEEFTRLYRHGIQKDEPLKYNDAYDQYLTENNTKCRSLGLKKIILVSRKARNNITTNISSSEIPQASYTHYCDQKIVNPYYEFTLTNDQVITNIYPIASRSNRIEQVSAANHFGASTLDISDPACASLSSIALKTVEFVYDYALCKYAPNSLNNQGKLTLNEIKVFEKDGSRVEPSYQFTYNNNPNYSKILVDNWGFRGTWDDLSSELIADAWSLTKIRFPLGGSLEIEYEGDEYVREAATNRPPEQDIGAVEFIDGDEFWAELFTKVDMNIFSVNNDYDFTIYIKDLQYTEYDDDGTSHLRTEDYKLEDSGEILEIDAPNHKIRIKLAEDVKFVLHLGDYSIYKYSYILANSTQYGGGLRVKSLVTKDEKGRSYENTYEYFDGVTSYSPTRMSRKEIDYLAEIPSPGVIYGKTKLSRKDLNGNQISSINYYHETMEQKKTSSWRFGDQLYLQDVEPRTVHSSYASGDQIIKPITYVGVIHNNTATIGRLLKVEQKNSIGQITETQTYNYYAKDEVDIGIFQESFHERKRKVVYHVNPNPYRYSVDLFLVNSSKKMYPSILKNITTTSQEQYSIATLGDPNESNYGFDISTGVPLIKITEGSDGVKYKTTMTPAYKIAQYSDMGSISINSSNKNMLIQGYQNDQFYENNGNWDLLSSEVQTWKGNWRYRGFNSSTGIWNDPIDDDPNEIWRKYKSFVLKGFESEVTPLVTSTTIDENFENGGVGNIEFLNTAHSGNHVVQVYTGDQSTFIPITLEPGNYMVSFWVKGMDNLKPEIVIRSGNSFVICHITGSPTSSWTEATGSFTVSSVQSGNYNIFLSNDFYSSWVYDGEWDYIDDLKITRTSPGTPVLVAQPFMPGSPIIEENFNSIGFNSNYVEQFDNETCTRACNIHWSQWQNSTSMSLTPGKNYTVSFDAARGENSPGDVLIAIQDNTGCSSTYFYVSMTPTNFWSHYSVVIAIPNTCSSNWNLYIASLPANGSGSGANCNSFNYVDNLKIVPVNNYDLAASENENLNNGWLLNSEIPRYNKYSFPIDTRNSNESHTASRFDNKDEFVIASVSNANYNSFSYTGFENVEQHGTVYDFEGEFLTTSTVNIRKKSDVMVYENFESGGFNNVFEATGNNNSSIGEYCTKAFETHWSQWNNKKDGASFPSGTYNVSYWAKKGQGNIAPRVLLYQYLGCDNREVIGSTLTDANWHSINGQVTIPDDCSPLRTIYLLGEGPNSYTLNGTNYVLIDDLKIWPQGDNGVKAHTGDYYLEMPLASQLGSRISPKFISSTKTGLIAGRTYRTSVWVHNSSGQDARLVATRDTPDDPDNSMDLTLVTKMNEFVLEANEWKLLNVDIDIPDDGREYRLSVYVRRPMGKSTMGEGAKKVFIDDLRVHPIDATMNSFVYDNKTGQVTAILDNENLATFYRYDASGRLVEVYRETGKGVKKVSENKYNYARN